MSKKKQDVIKRFYSHLNITDLLSCWNFDSLDHYGYGQFNLNNTMIKAHRFSFLLYYGEIDESLWVLHKCNNPSCCNPAHLYQGTPQDNTNDMIHANRQIICHGEHSPQARLTESQVIQIIELLKHKKCVKEIADKYLISPRTIYGIKKFETWKYIKRLPIK